MQLRAALMVVLFLFAALAIASFAKPHKQPVMLPVQAAVPATLVDRTYRADPIAATFAERFGYAVLAAAMEEKKAEQVMKVTAPQNNVTVASAESMAAAEPPRVEKKVEKPKPRDVCARHGMRKVVTRGGRSWRCRK